MENKKISPLKAIRLHCLDCCHGSSNEVKLCCSPNCDLFPFRFGKNPYAKKRTITEENKKKLLDGLKRFRSQNDS